MKCQCCENRIWVEPTFKSGTVQIMTKKGKIETGIEFSLDDAREFAQDILDAVTLSEDTPSTCPQKETP